MSRIFSGTSFIFTCTAFFWLASPAMAEDPLGIVTGPKTGTYYAIGKDMAEVARKAGIEVEIKSSEGSTDNIKRINSTENASIGIVQSDALGFLSRSQNPASIRMAGNLRLIFPLYNEEIHVLARKSIKNFKELKGKRVAIGEDGSGNMLTSINLFAMLDVSPLEMVKMPPTQGVVAVLKGDLDAVIFVSGKPVRLFKNLEDLALPENQKYAAMLKEVHFLPLDDPKLLEEYRPATVTHADYNFVPSTVDTVSMQAILISYDFSDGSKRRCDRLADFAAALRAALPTLKEKGHPKWKEVNLDAETGIWKKDHCIWPQPIASPRPAPASKKNTRERIRELDRFKGS